MSDRIDRRTFLAYAGITAAGVTLGQFGRRYLARADEQAAAWRARGLETWATSVCRECPAACGVRVRLIDGVPTKLEGNPRCPVGCGRLCAKGQAAIEAYFDPDRLVGPARRAGGRGEGRWEPLEWDAALDVLASRLGGTRPGEILAVAAEEHGPLARAWSTFWGALGARVVWTPAPTATRMSRHLAALTGAGGDPLFDLERATHVLSFGAPVAEDWLSPVWAQRSYGRFRRSDWRPRGRLVQIDDRPSLTARKADQWLAVPAEQQPFLAYGIGLVLLREGRIARPFLEEFGGDLARFERDLAGRFTPERVAAATGVPVVTVLRLARELTATSHPLAVVSPDADPDLIDAVLALDALIGAFDRPGGIFEVSSRSAAGEGFDTATGALQGLAAGRSSPRIVAFRDASALRTPGAPADVGALLERCELVVSFSPYLDEAAAVADLLLPAPAALESWQALLPAPASSAEIVACAGPAVAARLDTREPAAALGEIAARVGGSVATACPWNSAEELVRAEIDRLWHSRRGAPYSDAFEIEWVRQLESGGWWVPPAPSAEEFRELILGEGGWVDPFFAPGQIRRALQAGGGLTFLPPRVEVAALGSDDDVRAAAGQPRPGRAQSTGSAEFPLRLVTFTPAVVNLVGSPNQPVLFELLGQPESAPWRVWVEVSPETAREHGIAHGSFARVESVAGGLDVVALHAAGMPPGRVALAFVPAVPGGGRWARLQAADPRRLWARGEIARTCDVRLRKA